MRIALVGNQNSGKTTLFNLLTGTNQKVGNWPGVTIERKIGIIKGTTYEIVDLPGIYSMSPYTQEEEVSRRFIMDEKPDLIINIMDATSIERSLYLTTQLLELDIKMVIALNMSDMLLKKGIQVDTAILSQILQTEVIAISALKKTGIDDLIEYIQNSTTETTVHTKIYSAPIEQLIAQISQSLTCEHKRFVAVKLAEHDVMLQNLSQLDFNRPLHDIERNYGMDMEQIIANERYNYIVGVKQQCFKSVPQPSNWTDKLDKIFLNKWAAIPIFVLIVFFIYFLAVGVVGSATVDVISEAVDQFRSWLSALLTSWHTSSWLVSLVCDGIIAGVGAILNFLPQLMILFLCISLLETTGYMSRIAFLLDRIFRKFGLSGKSLIPFIVGSGCSVPGVMACRTIEDENEKRMSIMLTPFIPCSAKLPIIILFASFFFDQYAGLVSASLYFLAVIIILITALILKKFFFKGKPSVFISELPEYKIPSLRYVVRDILEKIWSFVKRAGTVIFVCSIAVWVLLSFTWRIEYIETTWHHVETSSMETLAAASGITNYDSEINQAVVQFKNNTLQISFRYYEKENEKWTEGMVLATSAELLNQVPALQKDERKKLMTRIADDSIQWGYSLSIENSILASIGNALAWVFYPIIGEWNWAATVSAFQGLVAKEQVVSSMAVISGFTDSTNSGQLIFASGSVFGHFTALSAYSFMVFNLFSAPCFGAIGAMRRELGSKKRMWQALLLQTGIAWGLASLIYGIGRLIGVMI